RRPRRADADARVLVPVPELEHLHQELDVDDAAPTRLDVRLLAGAAALALDALAHARDLLDLRALEPAPVDEALDDRLEPRPQGLWTRDRARLDQRLALPHLRARRVIGRERVQRGHERALVPGRPQP